MAFDPYVFAATMRPMARYPVGVRVWRLGVRTRNPHVVGSVPAVVTGLPDPAGMWGWRRDFVGRRRWPDGDVDLSAGGGDTDR